RGADLQRLAASEHCPRSGGRDPWKHAPAVVVTNIQVRVQGRRSAGWGGLQRRGPRREKPRPVMDLGGNGGSRHAIETKFDLSYCSFRLPSRQHPESREAWRTFALGLPEARGQRWGIREHPEGRAWTACKVAA